MSVDMYYSQPVCALSDTSTSTQTTTKQIRKTKRVGVGGRTRFSFYGVVHVELGMGVDAEICAFIFPSLSRGY